MRVAVLVSSLVLLLGTSCSRSGRGSPASSPPDSAAASSPPPTASTEPTPELRSHVDEGVARVEAFFGREFPATFEVRVFADRAALDEYWRARWAAPGFESQCWMVASGEHDSLALLSPDAWPRDACEHDPVDTVHLRQLVAHEVMHVFHDQVHPAPSFDDFGEELAWFIEGVAVLVSGQLETSHAARAREAIASGKAPTQLEDAWSGPFRYGVSGSLVGFVDQCFGREVLTRMLTVSSEDEALGLLGLDEPGMLAAWQAWAGTDPPGPCPGTADEPG